MSAAPKRVPLTKAQSMTNPFTNSLTALDKSGFLESIKQDSHLFAGLANDKPEQFSIKKQQIKQIKAQTTSNFPNTTLRQNPQQMQLYDEVSKLKHKQKRLEQTIRQLRQQNKDNHRPNLTKKQAEQLMELRRQNKQLNRSLFQAKTNLKGQSQKRIVSTLQKQKISDLLRIIEKYKSQAFQAQEQLRRYQQSDEYKNLGSNQSSANKKYQQTPVTNSQYINELSIIKQKPYGYQSPSMNIEMNRLKQQNGFLESEIRKMNAQISNKNMMQDEIYELKLQNQRLQNKLIKMSQSPIFGGMNERLEDQTKMKTLEDKVKMYNERFEKQKQKVIRLETQLKIKQKQLIDVNLEAQSSETENVKLRSRIKQHPIIDIIMRDQVMLQQVIGYLQAENYRNDILGTNKTNARNIKDNPLIKVETLIAQNQLLALQLTRNQTMLKTLKQIYQQHQKVRQLQQRQFSQLIQQKDKRINELAVLSGQKDKIQVLKNGIKYEDDVSVFSHDDRIIQQPGINYFDLYLAQINLIDTFVRQQIKIADVSKIMNFVSVDFYNHKTQSTKVSSGLRYNMNSQFSFKVVEDQCLFNFFEKSQITLDVWTTDGGKTIRLGEAKISLKPMISNSKSNIAPVIRSSVPLYINGKSIGSLNFVMRMRYPVYKLLSQMRSNILSSFDNNQALNINSYETKQLVVVIEAAEGLPMNVSSFVYYTINSNDYYTQPLAGNHPVYNYTNIVSICYTPQFEQLLRRGDLQFTVLDDNAPAYDHSGSDVIGTCKVVLSKLLFADGRISESLKIVNKNGEIRGNLIVKIFWSDNGNQQGIGSSIAQGLGNMLGGTGTGGRFEDTLAQQSGQLFTANFGMNSSNLLFSNIGMSNNTNNMNNMGMSLNDQVANGFNNIFSNRQPSTPQQINEYIKTRLGNTDNLHDLFKKFDDNNTGAISNIELKQLVAHFGIHLSESESKQYFNSFEKPITQDKLQRAFGIITNNNSNAPIKRTSSASSNNSSMNKLNTYSIDDLNNHLKQYMTYHNLTLEDLYKKFDSNKTSIMTKQELNTGLIKHFKIKLSDTQLETYFRSFKQPIDYQSFSRAFTNSNPASNIKMTTSINSNNIPSNPSNEQSSLKNINKLIEKNSQYLKKMSLKQYLKDKDLFTVSLEIDKDNSGTITKKQIQKYLEEKGLSTDEILEDKVSVMQFLKKHSAPSESIYESMNIKVPRTTSFSYRQ